MSIYFVLEDLGLGVLGFRAYRGLGLEFRVWGEGLRFRSKHFSHHL